MYQTFKKEVETGLATISKKIGFKKKKYNYYKPINEQVYATLGFSMGTHTNKGHIYVNVTIGVSHKNVEELRAKITGYNSLDIMQPTIGIQIGYLMPVNSFKEWDFVEKEDNSSLYEDILKNIQTYGFVYQDKMKNIDNLFEAFDKNSLGVLTHARDRYLPILYYLKGNKPEGLRVIEESLERQLKFVTDEEIKKTNSGESIVIRASTDKVDSNGFENMLKKIPSGGSIVIVGSGIGKVDPEYLKFVENYKEL